MQYPNNHSHVSNKLSLNNSYLSSDYDSAPVSDGLRYHNNYNNNSYQPSNQTSNINNDERSYNDPLKYNNSHSQSASIPQVNRNNSSMASYFWSR
jgi:hypothetical protein